MTANAELQPVSLKDTRPVSRLVAAYRDYTQDEEKRERLVRVQALLEGIPTLGLATLDAIEQRLIDIGQNASLADIHSIKEIADVVRELKPWVALTEASQPTPPPQTIIHKHELSIPKIPVPRFTRRRVGAMAAVATAATVGTVIWRSGDQNRAAQVQEATKLKKYQEALPLYPDKTIESMQRYSVDLHVLPEGMEYVRDNTRLGETEERTQDLKFVELKHPLRDEIGSATNGASNPVTDLSNSIGIRFDYYTNTSGDIKVVVNIATAKGIETYQVPLTPGLKFPETYYTKGYPNDPDAPQAFPDSAVLRMKSPNGKEALVEIVDTKKPYHRWVTVGVVAKPKS